MEILNTDYVVYSAVARTFGAISFYAGVFLLIITFICFLSKEWKQGLISLSGLVISVLILGLIIHNNPVKPQLEVTLNDGYVLDATKYKVIEQRGKIYTIREIR